MIAHTYGLDIVPGKEPPTVRLSNGDTDFVLYFDIYASEGELLIEEDTTAVLRGRRPDGTAYESAVVLDGNIAVVEGDSEITAVAGKGLFEISMTHDGKFLSTQNFLIVVEENPREESNDST